MFATFTAYQHNKQLYVLGRAWEVLLPQKDKNTSVATPPPWSANKQNMNTIFAGLLLLPAVPNENLYYYQYVELYK